MSALLRSYCGRTLIIGLQEFLVSRHASKFPLSFLNTQPKMWTSSKIHLCTEAEHTHSMGFLQHDDIQCGNGPSQGDVKIYECMPQQ